MRKSGTKTTSGLERHVDYYTATHACRKDGSIVTAVWQISATPQNEVLRRAILHALHENLSDVLDAATSAIMQIYV